MSLGLPNWDQAFPLGDLFWLRLELATRSRRVEMLRVEPLYYIFLLLETQ